VTEENQGAKRLHNREGFVDVEHIRFLQRIFSFKGAWLQTKESEGPRRAARTIQTTARSHRRAQGS
jgi:hypothetical protein